MSELTIHFTTRPNPNDGADQPPLLFVSLGFPARGLYTAPVPYEPPLDDQALNEIRWYLELFATWPSGPDYEKAEETKQKLESWGRDLWRSVIWHDTDQDLDGAGLWQQFADDAASPKQVTIDATDPRILRLPWELLADRRGHLLRVESASAAGCSRRPLSRFVVLSCRCGCWCWFPGRMVLASLIRGPSLCLCWMPSSRWPSRSWWNSSIPRR